MKMRLFISYCHDVIFSVGYSIDDTDSGGVMASEFIVYKLIFGLFARMIIMGDLWSC